MEFKLVISDPKTGKSMSKEVKEPDSKRFSGMKIGDKVKGELIDMQGYEFEITGGSDYAGFPMRKDIPGTSRKRILAVSGVGLRKSKRKGSKQRKTVAGNTIYEKTAQVNLKILKHGNAAPDPKAKEKAADALAEQRAGEKISDKDKAKEEKPKVETKIEKHSETKETPKSEQSEAEQPKPAEKQEEKEEPQESKAEQTDSERPKAEAKAEEKIEDNQGKDTNKDTKEAVEEKKQEDK